MALSRVLGLTPGTGSRDGELLTEVVAALRGGLALVVLREPTLDADELTRLAKTVVHHRRDGVLLHSKHPAALDLAQRAGWGIHLSASADWCATRHRIAGLVGASCHSHEDIARAEQAGCDYITLSPVFRPISKPDDTRTPLGLDGLQHACDSTSLPVFSLGGMDLDNATASRRVGAHGVAGITMLFGSAVDPEQRARALIAAIA